MIIWTGMGFLVAVFVFGCSLVANYVSNTMGGELYYDEHVWPFGVSLVVAALISWIVGVILANTRTKTLIDKETGEEVVIRPDHSLFFIKMHWWGPILLVAGVVLIVKDLI